jgi:catalase
MGRIGRSEYVTTVFTVPCFTNHPGTPKVLQVRLFPYGDTQRYRVGINAPQLPVNRPFHAYNPTRRDGAYGGIQPKGLPNYIPSIEATNIVKPRQYRSGEEKTESIQNIVNYQSQVQDEDFKQPAEWWSKLATLGEDQQANLVYNVASSLSGAVELVRNNAYGK